MSETSEKPTIPEQDPTLRDPGTDEAYINLRNQALDAILDPGGTIPAVVLRNRPGPAAYDREHPVTGQVFEPRYANYNYLVCDSNGNSIGRAVVYGHPTDSGDVIRVVETHIDVRLRGKGYGMAMYAALMKSLPLDTELACDPRGVSDDAYRLWKKFKSMGLAQRPSGASEPVIGSNGKYVNLGYRTSLGRLIKFDTAK